jgi:hypothetical protein
MPNGSAPGTAGKITSARSMPGVRRECSRANPWDLPARSSDATIAIAAIAIVKSPNFVIVSATRLAPALVVG